jgi:hypothetical protein
VKLSPGFLAAALVAGFLLMGAPVAGAAPFVFPDRPDLIFAFPDKPPGFWFSDPDQVAFPGDSTGFAGTSLGGSAGGSGSGGSGKGRSPNSLDAPFDLDTLQSNTLPNPLLPNAFSSGKLSQAAGGPTGYPGVVLFLVFPSDLPGEIGPETPRTIPYSPTPEPGTMLLVGAGLAGLLARRNRRRNV